MIDDLELERAAYQSERSASRRLAASTGIPLAAALRQTLTGKAGAGGLAQLLAERAALAAAQLERAGTRALKKQAQKRAHDGRQAPRYAHMRSEIPPMTREALRDCIEDLSASAE